MGMFIHWDIYVLFMSEVTLNGMVIENQFKKKLIE